MINSRRILVLLFLLIPSVLFGKPASVLIPGVQQLQCDPLTFPLSVVGGPAKSCTRNVAPFDLLVSQNGGAYIPVFPAFTGAVTTSAGSSVTFLGSFTLAGLNAAVSDDNVVSTGRIEIITGAKTFTSPVLIATSTFVLPFRSLNVAGEGLALDTLNSWFSIRSVTSVSSFGAFIRGGTATVGAYIGFDAGGIITGGDGTGFGLRSEGDLILMAGGIDAMRINTFKRVGIGVVPTTTHVLSLASPSSGSNGIYMIGPSEFSFQDNAHFNVTNGRTTISTVSMPQYGIFAPSTPSAAEMWISGFSGIAFFTTSTERMLLNNLGELLPPSDSTGRLGITTSQGGSQRRWFGVGAVNVTSSDYVFENGTIMTEFCRDTTNSEWRYYPTSIVGRGGGSVGEACRGESRDGLSGIGMISKGGKVLQIWEN